MSKKITTTEYGKYSGEIFSIIDDRQLSKEAVKGKLWKLSIDFANEMFESDERVDMIYSLIKAGNWCRG